MTQPLGIAAAKDLLLVATALTLVIGVCSCRRSNKDANSTGGASSPTLSDPEQARRQAQTLVEQGKEFYKNDEDEKAAKVLKEALTHDPDNAEAHLRLGMTYAS